MLCLFWSLLLGHEAQGVVGRKTLEGVGMQRWEYLRVSLWAGPGSGPEFADYEDWQTLIRGQHFTGWDEIEKAFDDLGSEGWELVTALPLRHGLWRVNFFFKRPKS